MAARTSPYLESDMEPSNERLTQALEEIKRLERENRELQNRVRQSTAWSMELQGGKEQITDGEVKKRFEGLYNAIQDWVMQIELELVRQSRHFQDSLEAALHREGQEELLWRLVLAKAYNTRGSKPGWDRNSKDLARIRWLGGLDTLVNVVLCRLVWTHLYSYLFSDYQFFGLDEDVMVAFDYIINAIANDGYEEGKINEAADIQHAITCSSVRYEFTECENLPDRIIPNEDQILEYTLKDIVTWRDRESTRGVTGAFCGLFPGVYRVSVEENRLLLVKPVVLVLESEANRQLEDQSFPQNGANSRSNKRIPKSDKIILSRHSAESSTVRYVEEPHHTSSFSRQRCNSGLWWFSNLRRPSEQSESSAIVRPPRFTPRSSGEEQDKGHRTALLRRPNDRRGRPGRSETALTYQRSPREQAFSPPRRTATMPVYSTRSHPGPAREGRRE
ncbi:hypothetical protein BDV28DRAFT_145341 [Aspergillus coremiiformis]|uniref:Uncharacterized protein n=1 Tax=Aspergillus coremiiformis TaxID=138285 RepID=A0A5N6ZHA7_9EURO|nr:hypothetical protein BDV28DRAFT_145341 [Aspergillus coremiiformis]